MSKVESRMFGAKLKTLLYTLKELAHMPPQTLKEKQMLAVLTAQRFP